MVLQTNPMNKNKDQDDIKLLGVFGIFKESLRLIVTWPKIFIPITLVSILPSCCISLVIDWSSMFQFCNMSTLGNNQVNYSPWHNDHILGSISRDFITCLLMKASLFIFSILSSLISISTIVYTIYCIYADEVITFRKAMSVVPKVWKPYMITYLSRVFASLAYSIVPIVGMLVFYFGKLGHQFLVLLILFVVAGLLYISMRWQLSDAISVMEKVCGFKALKKSRALIKGKLGIAFAIMLVAILCEVPILLPKFHEQLFKVGVGIGVSETIYYKILSVVWLSLVSLFLIVTTSVFYFVCKAYHHEDINKSLLSDHVDDNYGEYVSLKAQVMI